MEGSNATPVLDRQAALDRIDGDVELYEEILEVFLEDCPAQLSLLNQALDSADRVVTERHAHSLKSAAANVGGEAMRKAAAQLEHAARTAPMEQLRSLFAELEIEFNRLTVKCTEGGVDS